MLNDFWLKTSPSEHKETEKYTMQAELKNIKKIRQENEEHQNVTLTGQNSQLITTKQELSHLRSFKAEENGQDKISKVKLNLNSLNSQATHAYPKQSNKLIAHL